MPGSLCRVAVVGAVGSGKTTLAQELAYRIDAPCIELDALRYQPGWIEVSKAAFREKVAESVGRDHWVIDGNYADVQDLIWVRAQLLVWLDFGLAIVLWRLIRRTFCRLLSNEVFSDGKKEQLKRVFGTQSILIWAIRSHRHRRQAYEKVLTHTRYSHLQVVRLRSPADLHVWLAGMPRSNGGIKIDT